MKAQITNKSHTNSPYTHNVNADLICYTYMYHTKIDYLKISEDFSYSKKCFSLDKIKKKPT